MMATFQLPAIKIELDRVLECAVILSWRDLMSASISGSIHIEYRTKPDGSLEYLSAWSSVKRGYWRLICEYWMDPHSSHGSGLRFANGYGSRSLARMLELIMQHQDTFSKSSQLRNHGLIQVHPPGEKERIAAGNCMRKAFEFLGFSLTEAPAALWAELDLSTVNADGSSKEMGTTVN